VRKTADHARVLTLVDVCGRCYWTLVSLRGPPKLADVSRLAYLTSQVESGAKKIPNKA